MLVAGTHYKYLWDLKQGNKKFFLNYKNIHSPVMFSTWGGNVLFNFLTQGTKHTEYDTAKEKLWISIYFRNSTPRHYGISETQREKKGRESEKWGHRTKS